MARSELLRRLFASWAAGDANAFLDAALLVVDDERRKNHALLAGELESALRDPRRPGAVPVLSLTPLPKTRDDRPLLSLSKPRVTFEDLVLAPGAERALRDLTEENALRGVLATHALRPRQRLLLVGPSGTGKSAVAHAVAAELSLPVATASLAALTSSLLGETARNVEAVVRFADSTPCVLLLDEFDALAGERSRTGDHGELRRVVATVLQVLEESRGESLVVATSNHPGLFDSAIWRRFDEVVRLDALDREGVARLVGLRLRATVSSVDPWGWAGELHGLSPAEVEMVCLDALRQSVLQGVGRVGDEHMVAAVERLRQRQRAVAGGPDDGVPGVPARRRGHGETAPEWRART